MLITISEKNKYNNFKANYGLVADKPFQAGEDRATLSILKIGCSAKLLPEIKR